MSKYRTQIKMKRDADERDLDKVIEYLTENKDHITVYMDETGSLINGSEYAVFRFYIAPTKEKNDD